MSQRHRNLRRHRPRGVVIVIALLATFVLAGLVVHVLNIGRQVNGRVVAQNSADAAAAAGAGWIARTMNTVAMNNVAMARLIALVQILDAMPMTVQFTTEDQTAVWVAIREQLARGVSDWWTRDALQELEEKIRRELDILEPMDQMLNQSSYDIREMTFYNGPAGRGRIWRALEGLDEYNQAAMENHGVLAQLNAVRGGEINMGGRSEDNGVVMFPLIPEVPYERGDFRDFERPVRNGLLPADIDHKQYNRGPWDAVMGQRYRIGGQTHGYWQGNRTCRRQVTTDGRGTVPIGRGAGGNRCSGGKFVVTGKDEDRYGVYGPYAMMMRRVGNYGASHLTYSRFGNWASRISNPKLNYLWRSPATKFINDPEWIPDFPEAVQIAEAGDPRIVETSFIAVELKSKYPRTHPSFGTPGTWAYVDEGRQNPRIVRLNGWMDPRAWGVPQVEDYIWRDEWTYGVAYDVDIGIQREKDADGRNVEHTVYRVDDFVFVAVNIGEDVEIRNPNPTSKNGLPRPTQLNHDLVTRDEAARREFLTVLAVARRSDRPLMWNKKFHGDKPYPNMVAVAQASVFNNHSWDLYTQMWHTQITAITHYEDWLARLDASTGGPTPSNVDGRDVDDLIAYLTHAAELAEVALPDTMPQPNN